MVEVAPPRVVESDDPLPLSVLRAQERRRQRWLTGRTGAVRLQLGLAVAAGFAAGLLAVAQAWVLARLIAGAIAGGGVDRLLPAAGLAVLVFALRAGLAAVSEILATAAASRVKRALRAELVGALGRLGQSWLKTRRSGAVTATMIEQV